MGLFLSYSTRDRADIDDLLSALRRAHEEVWFDEDLGGGQVWWQKILERIRECDVFVFAMSENSLDSKPCLAELGYAQSLGKPVLPIQIGPVGSMRVTPLAAVEVIDFQHPTVETGIRLITGVQDARERATPLPTPLPDEPPVPFAYLMRLAAGVTQANLDPQEQAELIGQMRSAVYDDGGDPTTRGDIVQLLHTLRDRPDATAETRTEVAALLKTLGGSSHPVTSSATRRSRRWLIAIAAAVVCALAAVAIVVLTRGGKPAPSTAGSAAAPSGTSTPPSATLPMVPSQKLDSILLTPDEMATIMQATMQAEPVSTSLFPAPDDFSLVKQPGDNSDSPNCLGAKDVAEEPAYAGSAYSKVRFQHMAQLDPQNPDSPALSIAEQAAVSFGSAYLATQFFEKSAEQWAACKDKLITWTENGETYTDSIGPMSRSGNSISLQVTQEAGDGWDCQHTLAVHSNLVLEATACRTDIQPDDVNQASEIVTRMVEKAGA